MKTIYSKYFLFNEKSFCIVIFWTLQSKNKSNFDKFHQSLFPVKFLASFLQKLLKDQLQVEFGTTLSFNS